MKQIIYNKIRVQFFSEDIIHIEQQKKGSFCDQNTFFIPSKENYLKDVEEISYSDKINIGEYTLILPHEGKSLAGVKLFNKEGKTVYSYKKRINNGELPALNKTPEAFIIYDNPRIIVPIEGYTKDATSKYKIEENVQDIYILLCRKDSKKLRKLYVELTGRCELVRLSTLGSWNSKYYAYTEETAKQLILDYEKYNIPLDNMVIDTDWRACENGWGYDINTKLFPDMKRFLDFAHEHGIKIMFNDHPEPVNNKAHVFEPKEIEYREKNLQNLMNLGLDIWWYDRNWGTHLISPTKNVYWETFGLYLFSDITKHFYQKKSGNKEIYYRPEIMGNVVNVVNGCYQGIQDTASHRYSIQWTGDIASEADALSQEIDTMIKASNSCIAYVNADCGGHMGNPNKETFIRWMQFGSLSPVLRPHCTNVVKRFREPWNYDQETVDIVRDYINLRYRLLPVIYKNAFNNYMTGEPIFKSLGYEYPNDKKALILNDEYMLGNDILIAPIAGIVPQPIPKKNFIEPIKATYYNGTELQGEPIATAEYKELNIILNHTSPEKNVPVYNFSARFETTVQFDYPVELFVRSDDGSTVYVDGVKVHEDKTLHSTMNFPLIRIKDKEPHKVVIEYFQAGGEAAIGLYYGVINEDEKKKIYLPEGKWMNVFTGKIYEGRRTIFLKFDIKSMPLFVRLGALLPLAKEVHNTEEQKWDTLIFDFYPCKSANDSGYLYEDDTKTTAYKLGHYRISAYDAYFDKALDRFVLNFKKAKGEFEGEKAYKNREIVIRCHLIDDLKDVQKVLVNGKETAFEKVKKDRKAFPFNADKGVLDSDVILISVSMDVNEDYKVEIIM